MVTDSQLEQGRLRGYRVLIIPSPEHLTDRMRSAIEQFRSAGGTVIEQQPPWHWHDPDGGMALAERSFLGKLTPMLPQAPVRVTGGTEKMHAISFQSHDASGVTVALVNDFSWVFTGRRHSRSGEPTPGVQERIDHPSPPACRNVTIRLAGLPGTVTATDKVTGRRLEVRTTVDGVDINVPPFECVSVVVIDQEGG